jgi:hypothetical protein
MNIDTFLMGPVISRDAKKAALWPILSWDHDDQR